MIVTRQWLNEWIDISAISTQKLLETFNSIGLEVASYQKIQIPKKVVLGYVKSRQKHENSDHLSVCEVDIGSEILQIVCGAKNVEMGQFVAVACIGANLPNGVEIKKAKLRGIESCGMICSAIELGLPKLNDGIMVLDESIGELKLGGELGKFPLLNDEIIEIDLTPNRGDCLSIYGIARDLSAVFGTSLRQILPHNDNENLLGIGRILSLKVSDEIKAFLEYKAIHFKGQVGGNLLMRLRLCCAGIMKDCLINNILSYAMHTTGVLFRAYDFEKIANGKEKILLEVVKNKNDSYAIMHENSELCLIGLSQNKNVKICENSKILLIEASYIDPKEIAVIAHKNKDLCADEYLYKAVRGSETNLDFANDYLFEIFNKFSEITPFNGSQRYFFEKEEKIISINTNEQNLMIGQNIDRNEVSKILKRLGFEVIANSDNKLLSVKIPPFRPDIENSHDICEEIVRIIGIDKITPKAMNFSENNRLNSEFFRYKNKTLLRKKAVANGFFECIFYLFDSSAELGKLGFDECKLKLINPINSDLDTLKPTLINHLLKAGAKNFSNYKKSIRLFELGEVFDKNGSQSTKIAFLHSGLKNEPSILNGAKSSEIEFFSFASKIQNTIGEFELKVCENFSFLSKFEQGEIVQNGVCIGYIGRLNLDFQREFDLPKTYVCEIDFDKILFLKPVAKIYSKMPSISRDLSLVAPKNLRYGCVKKCIEDLEISDLKEFRLIDIYEDENLGQNLSLTINFVFQNMQNSLTDDEISDKMDQILSALKKELNLEIR